MHQVERSPGRTAIVDGEEYLFFSGYSYLGMGHVPEFVELVKKGMDLFGILHPSSRISNTQLRIYQEFEQLLSAITKQEETVSFSSGYLAGRAIVNTLIESSTVCYVLPNSHPTLDIGTAPFTGTEEDLVNAINKANNSNIVLLADAVNPLQASITDFSFLRNVPPTTQVTCIIDDSHGIGLIGKGGSGIQSSLTSFANVDYVLTYSLSKGYHLNGGAVSCSRTIASKLRASPYYTGSTAISPSLAYAFIHSQSLYAQQQEKLKNNIASFTGMIKHLPGLHYHKQLPLFILDENYSSDAFEEQNIIISSFSYPDPTGQKVNRIVLNALHTNEDLEKLAKVLHQQGH